MARKDTETFGAMPSALEHWQGRADKCQQCLPGDTLRGSGPAKPPPEFGWSHSRIHRIEPMEGGGVIVWISDNCFVAIGVIAMPMCKLGKRPARGNLFEHMDDPPAPGDWKDD